MKQRVKNCREPDRNNNIPIFEKEENRREGEQDMKRGGKEANIRKEKEEAKKKTRIMRPKRGNWRRGIREREMKI